MMLVTWALGTGSRSVLKTPVAVTRRGRAPAAGRAPTHKAPPVPVTSGPGCTPAGSANSVTAPAGVTRPSFWAAAAVYHRLPSGPAAMAVRPLYRGAGKA